MPFPTRCPGPPSRGAVIATALAAVFVTAGLPVAGGDATARHDEGGGGPPATTVRSVDASGASAAAPRTSEPSERAPSRVAEPAGYRLEDYDAPVPDALAGARTVAAPEVRALLARGAVVVDVVPAHRRPPSLAREQLWLPPPHAGVPGALWLPDTGFGALDPVTERYFLGHLARASDGAPDTDLVFYCRMDCWMSWNAAKRALAAGYERVHWYRDGIDDWRFEGLPTEALVPAAGERLPAAGER